MVSAVASRDAGKFKDTPFDYGSVAIGPKGEKVNLQFVPARANVETTFTKELVKAGLDKAMKKIEEDQMGAILGFRLIQLYYHNDLEGYRVVSIQYADGSETHLI